MIMLIIKYKVHKHEVNYLTVSHTTELYVDMINFFFSWKKSDSFVLLIIFWDKFLKFRNGLENHH